MDTKEARVRPHSIGRIVAPVLLLAAVAHATGVAADETSPKAEPRGAKELYQDGIRFTEAQQLEKAIASFEELVAEHPRSAWTGAGYVWLIDVKLERRYDLPGAAAQVAAAMAWYETTLDAPPAPADDGESSPLPSHREIGRAIYLRAGLVESLLDRPSEAAGFFEKAKSLEPGTFFQDPMYGAHWGVKSLIASARANKPFTPAMVRQGASEVGLILLFADTYCRSGNHEKSLELCNRLLHEDAIEGMTAEQRSYAHFRRGRNYFRVAQSPRNVDLAYGEFVQSSRLAPGAPWGAQAKFQAANILWNKKQDHEGAIAGWREVIRTYPDSPEAQSSVWFIGATYQAMGRLEDAKRAFEEFLYEYPTSRGLRGVRADLAQVERAIEARDRKTQLADSDATPAAPPSAPTDDDAEYAGPLPPAIRFHGSWIASSLMDRLGHTWEGAQRFGHFDFEPEETDQLLEHMASGKIEFAIVQESLLPDKQRKEAAQYESIPVARIVLCVVVHEGNSVREMTLRELIRVFLEGPPDQTWEGSLDGRWIKVFVPHLWSNTTYIFQKKVFEAVHQLPCAVLVPPQARVPVTEMDIHAATGAVAKEPDGIAFGPFCPDERLDVRARILGVAKDLESEAVVPTPESIADGSYPIQDRLVFYVSPDASEAVRRFVAFATGPKAAPLIRRVGMWPEYELKQIRSEQQPADAAGDAPAAHGAK